jgi:putative transferase (TIGR04331 family)
MKLQLHLGQVPYYLSLPRVQPSQITAKGDQLRNNFILDCGRNRFESILDDLIPAQIPMAYLEKYNQLFKKSLELYPKSPKTIFTGNANRYDDGFKLWVAYQVEHGAKLIIGQHGGHYGVGSFSHWEEEEINSSSYYYTWGWQTDGAPKIVPVPATKLIPFQRSSFRPDPKGSILWVAMSLPRYSYGMLAMPTGPQVLNYLNEQVRFFYATLPTVQNLLVRRLYSTEYGWEEVNRWQELAPKLRIYQGTKSMIKQIKESRLVIATYNATTYLETFTMNFPTIMFWKPEHWELRPEAQPYFDELYQVGILHKTPESAAIKVNQVYNDPLNWWNTPEVQKAKNQFCDKFARTSENWVKEWKDALIKSHIERKS